MKNLIAAAIIAIVSLPSATAASESWTHVLEGENGARLIVDVSSFATAVGDDNTPYIGANFRYVADGKLGNIFVFVIDPNSCNTGGGELYARVWRDNKWVTRDTYFWTDTGNRMYDHGAQSLCTIHKAINEANSKGKGKRSATL